MRGSEKFDADGPCLTTSADRPLKRVHVRKANKHRQPGQQPEPKRPGFTPRRRAFIVIMADAEQHHMHQRTRDKGLKAGEYLRQVYADLIPLR